MEILSPLRVVAKKKPAERFRASGLMSASYGSLASHTAAGTVSCGDDDGAAVAPVAS
jgi:hypothetical protein